MIETFVDAHRYDYRSVESENDAERLLLHYPGTQHCRRIER